jgi:hypothetical protein
MIDDPAEIKRCVELLDKTVRNLDDTVHLIQETIDKAEYLGGNL